MARKAITQYFDDLDGSALESDQVNSIKFGVDGHSYIIDLSPENAEKFRETLAPYIKVAAKDEGITRSAARRTDTKLVRKWARDNGFAVHSRGTLPTEVYEAYDLAHRR